ncbi:hypothetical protein, partial [Desulforhabdus sp. TSK]|uniref:helix-turn-helix domain-containing protein n=1 Tax=Desulforhabdus sp. TSK TaxID=2925014 RepID=UPI00248498C6
MNTPAIDTTSIGPAWRALQNILPVRITPIRDDDQFQRVIHLMNALLDVVGDNEEHELADFLELIGRLVEDYENEHIDIPDAPTHEVLHFLMDQQGLEETDLSKELGGQPVVSAILSGRRKINVR